jgi:hypothetical protein
MNLTKEWLIAHQGRIVPVPDEGDFLMAPIDRFLLTIMGNEIIAYDLSKPDENGRPEEIGRHQCRSYGGPVYDSLEEFLRQAGEHAKIGFLNYEHVGRVFCLYDHGPEVRLTHGKDGKRLARDDYYTSGGNMGYAYNIDVDYFSEWDIIHAFPAYGEDDTAMNKRLQANLDATLAFLSEGGEPAVLIDAVPPLIERRS